MARLTSRIGLTTTTMRSVYDAIAYVVALFSSAAVAALSGTTAQTSAYIDTKGYNSAMLVGHADAATGSPSAATAAFTLTESDASGSGFAAANDNTGTQIGFTLTNTSAAADGAARIEGLGDLNRKRYLKVVITPAFTGGTSPATNAIAYILLGRAYELPANTAVSNT